MPKSPRFHPDKLRRATSATWIVGSFTVAAFTFAAKIDGRFWPCYETTRTSSCFLFRTRATDFSTALESSAAL